MTTSAKTGFGILVSLANYDSPSTFVDLGEVLSVTAPALSRDAIDASHTASANRYRDYIAGLRDAGEVTVEFNYVPGGTGDDQMLLAFADDDPWNLKILFADGTSSWTCPAFLTSYEPSAPHDDKMTLSVTFKLTGQPTFTG